MNIWRKRKLKCPFCKQVLVSGPMRDFETIGEHVMCPNAENLPKKPTLECACTPNVFWEDGWGDMYIIANSREQYLELCQKNRPALNSGSHKFNREKKREAVWKTLHIYWLVRRMWIASIHVRSLIRHHRFARGYRV